MKKKSTRWYSIVWTNKNQIKLFWVLLRVTRITSWMFPFDDAFRMIRIGDCIKTEGRKKSICSIVCRQRTSTWSSSLSSSSSSSSRSFYSWSTTMNCHFHSSQIEWWRKKFFFCLVCVLIFFRYVYWLPTYSINGFAIWCLVLLITRSYRCWQKIEQRTAMFISFVQIRFIICSPRDSLISCAFSSCIYKTWRF